MQQILLRYMNRCFLLASFQNAVCILHSQFIAAGSKLPVMKLFILVLL